MCELLALSFNQQVSPKFSFKGFRNRGDYNPDGWGLAFYPDESVQVIKEPIKAGISHLSEFLMSYPEIKSKIIIAHVRYMSSGDVKYKNTHPFQRELNGKEFVFAHNGTLNSNFKTFDTGRFKPVGDTDSEYAFCLILNGIDENEIGSCMSENFEWLQDKLKEINIYGDFNCVFSDSEYLYCYFDKDSYNGLHFVQRKAPYGYVRLSDEDYEIDLSEEKNKEQTGFIVATRPLTKEKWEMFNPGELIVFSRGRKVFPN